MESVSVKRHRDFVEDRIRRLDEGYKQQGHGRIYVSTVIVRLFNELTCYIT